MIVSVFLAPLIEEAVLRLLVFDVVLLRSLGQRVWPALVLQALVFVWWESPESLARAAWVFLAGLLLGRIYLRKQYKGAVAAHAALNAAILTINWAFSG